MDTKTWKDRLREAVDADGRSMGAISLASGHGRNFVQQLFKNNKEPGIDKLGDVLKTLGTASTLYVIAGVKFSREDEDMLSALLALDDDLRGMALDYFERLSGVAEKRQLVGDPPSGVVATHQTPRTPHP